MRPISNHHENFEHHLRKCFNGKVEPQFLNFIDCLFCKVFLVVAFVMVSAQFNLKTISTQAPQRQNSKIYVIKTTPRPNQQNTIDRPKAIRISVLRKLNKENR